MNPLPTDLADLERELTTRSKASTGPSALLRGRVLAAVVQQLEAPRGANWSHLAYAAAAVLLMVNLSMSVAMDTDWSFGPRSDPAEYQETVTQVRGLLPDLPERDIQHLAVRTRLGF